MIGDILVVRNRGWIFRQVRKLTKAKYDHVAVFVSEHYLVEATPTRGVSLVPIGKYRNLHKKILRLKNGYNREKFAEFSLMKIGRKYDFLNLFGLYLKVALNFRKEEVYPLDVKNAFICCELVTEGATYAGFSFGKESDTEVMTPADIIKSKCVKKVGR